MRSFRIVYRDRSWMLVDKIVNSTTKDKAVKKLKKKHIVRSIYNISEVSL